MLSHSPQPAALAGSTTRLVAESVPLLEPCQALRAFDQHRCAHGFEGFKASAMTSQLLRIAHRHDQLFATCTCSRTTSRSQCARPLIAAKAASVTRKLKSIPQKGTQRMQPKKSASKQPSKPSFGTVVKRKARQVRIPLVWPVRQQV